MNDDRIMVSRSGALSSNPRTVYVITTHRLRATAIPMQLTCQNVKRLVSVGVNIYTEPGLSASGSKQYSSPSRELLECIELAAAPMMAVFTNSNKVEILLKYQAVHGGLMRETGVEKR